jgi:hypothetical protein
VHPKRSPLPAPAFEAQTGEPSPHTAGKHPPQRKNLNPNYFIHPKPGDPLRAAKISRRKAVNKFKLTEDWLATIVAFVLMGLAVINLISPTWMKF